MSIVQFFCELCRLGAPKWRWTTVMTQHAEEVLGIVRVEQRRFTREMQIH